MSDKMNSQRRALLKKTFSASTLALVASSGLLLPQRLLAHWPSDAFTAEAVEDAILAIMGQAEIVADETLSFSTLHPPKKTVSGDSVTVQIHSELDDIERIAILVENNPYPLVMSLDLTPAVKLPFKTRIKIAEDSSVIALARADGVLYTTKRFVSVEIGGDV
jgi:sulfur-oxidizing protein SoxY